MKARQSRKKSYETSVPVNITLPPLLHEKMKDFIRAKGFNGPSDYIQARIRLDTGLTLTAPDEQKAA